MISPITIERWQQAQKAERECHKMGFFEGLGHYAWVSWQYDKFVSILDRDIKHSSVIEVGPADSPMLAYADASLAYVVEPMPSNHLEIICTERHIEIINQPFEEIRQMDVSEVWLLNVLQHVIDPERIIHRAKEMGKIIRFFEPINQPTCDHHPHTFTEEDFRRWFGDCVKIYDDRLPYFFNDKCAYGVWIKDKPSTSWDENFYSSIINKTL